MRFTNINLSLVTVFLIQFSNYGQQLVTLVTATDLEDPAFYRDANPGQLKSLYFEYLYLTNKLVLLKEKKTSVSVFASAPEISYRAGDISALERMQLEKIYTGLLFEISNLTYDIAITENRIKQLLCRDINVLPQPDTLYKRSSFEVNHFISQHQKIQPDPSDSLFHQFINKENILLAFEKINEGLNHYVAVKLPLGHKLKKDAALLLMHEEISLPEYTLMVCEYYDMMLDYYKLINEYNQAGIKIESYDDTAQND